MNTQLFDIVIIGGGLVGMTLAHALAGHGWQIALVDAKPLAGINFQDDRSLALSYASQQIFSALNLWKNIAAQATAINSVNISRRGLFAKTHLRAADIDLPALGYVVPAQRLANSIAESLAQHTDIKIFAPALVESIEIKERNALIKLAQQPTMLSARLVIGADGSQSRAAEQLNIPRETHHYQQMAIVTTLSSDIPHNGNAVERFSEQGVIALLPSAKNNYGVVWTTAQEHALKLLNLSNEEYLAALNNQLGFYLGKNISIQDRSSYPLTSSTAYERIRPRFILLGNAAHTVHPVAAQGLNLALRSVAWLAEILVEAQGDIGDLSILKLYQQRTQGDVQQTQVMMHGLAEITTQMNSKFLWGMGLNILDKIPLFKRNFIRHAAGLAGRQAKLIRGIELIKQ